MEIITLASGSSGNCTVIKSKNTTVLVDMGISCRRTTNFLKDLGISPENVSAILITHEHNDHIKGIPVFSKKYGVPVAAIKEIWTNELLDVKPELRVNLRRRMKISDIVIDAFETAHDSIYPVGYTFYDGRKKVGVATDTGYVTKAMEECLADVKTLVIEANHDENMLMEGSYPYFLKKRVLSNKGHLSNNACGDFLSHKASRDAKIILAHLSEENNTPEVALTTIYKKFANRNKEGFCNIEVAPRLSPACY